MVPVVFFVVEERSPVLEVRFVFGSCIFAMLVCDMLGEMCVPVSVGAPGE